MAQSNAKSKIVFSIYPNANGFGYVYLESARKLLDHGTIRINPINNVVLLGRIKKLLEYIRPSIVIAVDPEGKYRTRRRRDCRRHRRHGALGGVPDASD